MKNTNTGKRKGSGSSHESIKLSGHRFKLSPIQLLILCLVIIVASIYQPNANKQQGHDVAASKPTLSSNASEFVATVVSVHDGDTLRIHDRVHEEEIKIRLIGIDTPEINKGSHKEQGKRATKKLKELCLHKQVYLEYDKGKTDRYGRTLAYLWLKDPHNGAEISQDMINYLLVREGYAEILEVKPNTRYASLFKEAQELARQEKQGLWKEGDFRKFPDKDSQK